MDTAKSEVNDKNTDFIINSIKQANPDWNVYLKYDNQLDIQVSQRENIAAVTFLKALGFSHLSNMTCIDWISNDIFQVIYNLWSYKSSLHAIVKVNVGRKHPVVPSIQDLWPHAKVYEQELHEFFGIVSTGNPNMKPLFLHNWLDIPPLRKDFDTESYSKKAFGFLEEDNNVQ